MTHRFVPGEPFGLPGHPQTLTGRTRRHKVGALSLEQQWGPPEPKQYQKLIGAVPLGEVSRYLEQQWSGGGGRRVTPGRAIADAHRSPALRSPGQQHRQVQPQPVVRRPAVWLRAVR